MTPVPISDYLNPGQDPNGVSMTQEYQYPIAKVKIPQLQGLFLVARVDSQDEFFAKSIRAESWMSLLWKPLSGPIADLSASFSA